MAVVLTAAIVMSLGVLAPRVLGVRMLHGQVPETAPRTAVDLEARWDEVLCCGVVRNGRVDYGRLANRRAQLARFVGALAAFGPRSVPGAFRDRDSRLAYYINAYNALVIFAVLERDVRTSVHDVRGWLEPVAGMGFFWAQRFEVDGQQTNLHALENDVLRARFSDARIHAAINCASTSCPPLAAHAYHGSSLDTELDRAAERFTSPPYVVVDDRRREVVLNAIYEWYDDDFVTQASSLGMERSVLAWIAHHSTARDAIDRARRCEYAVRHAAYDWSLNGHW